MLSARCAAMLRQRTATNDGSLPSGATSAVSPAPAPCHAMAYHGRRGQRRRVVAYHRRPCRPRRTPPATGARSPPSAPASDPHATASMPCVDDGAPLAALSPVSITVWRMPASMQARQSRPGSMGCGQPTWRHRYAPSSPTGMGVCRGSSLPAPRRKPPAHGRQPCPVAVAADDDLPARHRAADAATGQRSPRAFRGGSRRPARYIRPPDRAPPADARCAVPPRWPTPADRPHSTKTPAGPGSSPRTAIIGLAGR